MQCKKCGAQVEIDSKFCMNCGSQINENVQTNTNNMYQQQFKEMNDNTLFNQQMQYQSQQSNNNLIKDYGLNTTNKETLGTVSLILGIISLVLAYPLNILILPLAITGLILGIINKRKKGKKIAGIVLNVISLFIIVIMIIISVFVLKSGGFNFSSLSNPVTGEYYCTGVDSNTDKYLITLHLNKDNTFLYGPYGDLKNNYAIGTYIYEDEHKTNGNREYKYYMVTMEGPKEDFIINGSSSENDFNSKMEFGITSKNGKKQGVIMFVNTYNMYYCYEK